MPYFTGDGKFTMNCVHVIVDSCSWIFTGLTDFFVTVTNFLPTLFDYNYSMMSVVIRVGVNFLSTVWAVLKFIYVGLYTVLVCAIDFLTELVNFISALLYLLWKICLLILSLLDLVFHLLEGIAYFLWTGGKWTAKAITASGHHLSDASLSTWKYFVISFKDFTNSIVGGFTTLGVCAKSLSVFIYDVLCISYGYMYDCILYADFIVRYGCRHCVESVYYFFTEYLLNLPKEAYLGFMICCVSSVIVKNVITLLCSEGLTFPISSWFGARVFEDYDSDFGDYENERGEFSDDDDAFNYTFDDMGNEEDMNDEFSVNSDYSESSDDEDDSNSDEELEIDSDSDNDSNAASEISDINIQLPDLHGDRYNDIRQSVTPSRVTEEMSHQDLQKVIESEKEKRMCVVCQDRSKSVLVLPCRHMCLCLECANRIARSRTREHRKCPLCRTRINTIMNVYI